jgi:cbb3-type cytochrome oxidase maturation protein
MEIIYLLIPLSMVLVGLIAWIFVWAIRSGQFDDMEGPAHRILMDNDDIVKDPEDEPQASHADGTASNRQPRP